MGAGGRLDRFAAVGVDHQLQGGGADVADPALGTAAHLVVVRIVADPDQIAVAGLDVDPVVQFGGEAEAGQRGQVIVTAVDGFDVVEVTAPLGEHREDIPQRQPPNHRQGGALATEVIALHIPVAGRQVTQLTPQVLGEVVAAEQGERGGVLARILAKVTQIVSDGPAATHPGVPVVVRRRLGTRGRQCQCNPNRFYFYVHRVSSSMLV